MTHAPAGNGGRGDRTTVYLPGTDPSSERPHLYLICYTWTRTTLAFGYTTIWLDRPLNHPDVDNAACDAIDQYGPTPGARAIITNVVPLAGPDPYALVKRVEATPAGGKYVYRIGYVYGVPGNIGYGSTYHFRDTPIVDEDGLANAIRLNQNDLGLPLFLLSLDLVAAPADHTLHP